MAKFKPTTRAVDIEIFDYKKKLEINNRVFELSQKAVDLFNAEKIGGYTFEQILIEMANYIDDLLDDQEACVKIFKDKPADYFTMLEIIEYIALEIAEVNKKYIKKYSTVADRG